MTPISLALWQRLRRLDAAGCTISIQRRVPMGCFPGDHRRVWYTHIAECLRLGWQGPSVELPEFTPSVEQATCQAEARGWGRPCVLPATVPIDEELWGRAMRLAPLASLSIVPAGNPQ